MITDPNYFRTGAQWPPRGDTARVRRLYDYSDLYYNDARSYVLLNRNQSLGPATGTIFENIDRSRTVVYPKYRINLFRKISNFWKDMLFSFPPIVSASNRGQNRNIEDLMTKIFMAAPKVAIDTSRYGTGVYFISSNQDGSVRVEAIPTYQWFPIVARHDQYEIIGDYIAVPYNIKPEEPHGQYGDRIRVSRYVIGEPASVQTFRLEGTILGTSIQLQQGPVVEQRAVVTVPNKYESEHYGESDYPDLIDPVSEINRRMSGASDVLDAHADPHLQGPRSAVQVDASGQASIPTGTQYFPLEPEDPKVEYVTWDSDMEANFIQVSRMVDFFCAMSDTSPAAMGINEAGGRAAESGSALRKLLYPSFLRLSGLRRAHEHAIRQVVQSVYPAYRLDINWPDPFLDGLLEQASAEEVRLRSGATTPAEAIARLDYVTSGEADRIAQRAANNPTLQTNEAGMGAGRGRSGDPRPNG